MVWDLGAEHEQILVFAVVFYSKNVRLHHMFDFAVIGDAVLFCGAVCFLKPCLSVMLRHSVTEFS